MKLSAAISFVILLQGNSVTAFQSIPSSSFSHDHVVSGRTTTPLRQSSTSTEVDAKQKELDIQKEKLFKLIGTRVVTDSILVDPFTKEPLEVSSPGISRFGSNSASNGVKYTIKSASNKFTGSSGTFIDLLEVAKEEETTNASPASATISGVTKRILPLVPVFLRKPLAQFTNQNGVGEEYIPMRDLFTSPAVSFAYERGWRQNFAVAGFPGPDVEAKLAMDYFAPVVAESPSTSVVVDMSCATGLFTRRFAESQKYKRVLGCDYSESMLTEARRRIRTEPKLAPSKCSTTIDLVRLDVGKIPMRNESLDCLHAGAAMHCWPELDKAASEIYRVLKPGGRYFATTFLQRYFKALQAADGGGGGGANGPSLQAFQYFESTDTLKDLMVRGGFAPENVQIEVLGTACVVIRCEK